MLKKILTGAFNDVERGALDFALSCEIAHGGWAPLGWLSKSGLDRNSCNLQEVPNGGSPNYAERNIFDADGTLLITVDKPVGASELVLNFARRYQHPLLHIDLATTARYPAAQMLAGWIDDLNIEVLNVTGGAPYTDRDLGSATRGILETAVLVIMTKSAMDAQAVSERGAMSSGGHGFPGTVDEALEALQSLLGMKEKIKIARTPEEDLPLLISRLGDYIDRSLGWWQNNDALIASCRSAALRLGKSAATPDEVLIRALWQQLRKSHGLRVID
jgi:hypothetical protein